MLKGLAITPPVIGRISIGKVVEKNMEASENEALVGDFIDKLDKDKIGDLSC